MIVLDFAEAENSDVGSSARINHQRPNEIGRHSRRRADSTAAARREGTNKNPAQAKICRILGIGR